MLQAADLFLTRELLPRQNVHEANPLAQAVLLRHGWMGVALLKIACTVVALSMALLVWRRRAATAARLLGGFCALMTLVVGYSLALLLQPSPGSAAELAVLRQRSSLLDAQTASLNRLQYSRAAICSDLLDGRLLFPRAVEKMAQAIDGYRVSLPPSNRDNLPATDRPSHVAVYLIFHLRMHAEGGKPNNRLAVIESELETCYPRRPVFDFAAIQAALATGQPPPWAPAQWRETLADNSPSS